MHGQQQGNWSGAPTGGGRRRWPVLLPALPLAVVQETLQLLGKARAPGFDEGRDLLTDLLGLGLAYLFPCLWQRRRPSFGRSGA